jgi:putative DNA primase/helicase
MTPLERILQALREHGIEAKQSGADWMCRCPVHDDHTPSLSVREDKPGGRIFVKCFAGCSDTDVLERLGLAIKDLFPEGERASLALSVRSGLTVEELAAAKKLPVDFLKSLGVDTTWLRKPLNDPETTVIQALVDPATWESMEFKSQWREVLIPYRHADGSDARARRRMKVSGKPKHCWAGTKEEHGGIVSYGLDRLQKARDVGYLILVEGETDCWALWLHEFPALGVPGASITKTLRREQFDGIDRVYLIQEPDTGGDTFCDAVRDKLSSWKSWKGDLFVLREPGGAKDVCDLRARDPEYFTAAMEEALAYAESVSLEANDGKPRKTDPEKIKAALASSEIRPLTDMGNAERLIARHGRDLRYCYEMGKWFVWFGNRWVEDRAAAERKAKDAVRVIPEETTLVDGLPGLSADDKDALKDQITAHARQSESRPRLYAMLDLAQSEEGVQIHASDLDHDHWLFNVQNGTVDLRTGEFRPHDRADLITRIAGVTYDSEATAPLWERFVSDVMAGDQEMIDYLRRVVGYCLTGEVSEQCLFFLWGKGSNGKSTFTELVMALLGGLAHKSETSIFTTTRASNDGGRATPELSRMRGRRLVVTSELGEGKRVDEARVKDLTGKDTIVARGLFQDFIEFQPTHKLFVFGNHKPTVKGTDHGIWRRIRLIPFTEQFDDTMPHFDANLDKKMVHELPGILNWAIAGCLQWQQQGLGIPDRVKKATDAYRTDMDVIGQFLNDRCVQLECATVRAAELYTAYCEWARDNGERELSQKALALVLQERGFEKTRSKHSRAWKGLCLSPFDDVTGSDEDDIPAPKPPQVATPQLDAENASGKICRPEFPKGDALVTDGDASETKRVTPQVVDDKEPTQAGDGCDAFCTHTHTPPHAGTCTRARDEFSEEDRLNRGKRVTTRHPSPGQSCPDDGQPNPPEQESPPQTDNGDTPPDDPDEPFFERLEF